MKIKIPGILILGLLSALPAAAQEFPRSFADLVEKLMPAVVNISTTQSPESFENDENISGLMPSQPRLEDFFTRSFPKHTALGSGFVIDESGYILTNNHVIDKAEEISVILSDNSVLQAEVIGSDTKTDIALIKVNSPVPLLPVKLGNSDKIRVGDWILAIGNPFGLGGSVTAGIVSAKSRDIESGPYDNFIQTDASINQGSSGGPMFNTDGEVIGVNTAIFSTTGGSMGIGFAIPVNQLKFVIAQLQKFGEVRRGWIGLKIQPYTAEISASLGGIPKEGLLVSGISENSPAAKAGIEAGDVVTELNGKVISDGRRFSQQIAETAPGQQVKLKIFKNKKERLIALTTEKMPLPALKSNIEKLQETQETPRFNPLGLQLSAPTSEILDKYHLSQQSRGVVITDVEVNSDAAAKGLRPGILVTQADKQDLSSPEDANRLIQEAKLDNNRPVLLQINDNGLVHFVAVKLK